MKKKLIICSLLCFLASAMTAGASMAVSGASNEAPLGGTTTTISTELPTASILETPDEENIPNEENSEQSPKRINLFGKSMGIFYLDWEFELSRITTNADENEDETSNTTNDIEGDSDYIADDRASDNNQSMMLNLTLPLGENGNALQIKMGLDVQQALPLKKEESVEPPVTDTITTNSPTTQAPITQAPTTTKQPSGSGAIPTTVPAMEYTEEDLLWLARIIHAEARGESMECKIAVGTVVLNRVASSRHPDTIYGVIFQKNQFTPASSGAIYNNPSEESYEAARRCLAGERTDTRILYFVMTKYAANSWAGRNRKLIAVIGSESFYA